MWEKSEQGKIILGGCCIESDSPTHNCNECKKQFQDKATMNKWMNDED